MACVTETWLNSDKPNAMIQLPDYTLYRRDRCSTNTPWSDLGGGGAAIYVHSSIKSRRRTDLEHSSSEVLVIEIQLASIRFLVACIYRPPRQPMPDHLPCIDSLVADDDLPHCILLGDFNATHTSWNSHDQTNHPGRVLQQKIDEVGLTIVNQHSGTRPSATSNHLLDLIVTNMPHLFESFKVLPPLSDHCPVIAYLKVPQMKPTSKHTRWVRKCDYTELRKILIREPLAERIGGDVHVDHMWQAWNTHFQEAVQRCTFWEKKTLHSNKNLGIMAHLLV